MTPEQADALITYLETMEAVTDHQHNMRVLSENGFSETDLDVAARALSAIAGRDYSIL